TSLLGKILRIDVDNTDAGKNYAIPSDNPYVSNGSALDEIWAYGLRNPWKFSFDRTTNDLWIADVGQMTYEEINMATPSVSSLGLNYGWRCYEGNSTYNTSGCANPSTMTFPIAEYSHSGSGVFKCSITGGYRHRGITQASLNGLYFFADYCSDEIGVLEQSGMNWTMSFTQQYNGNGWSCFGEDINGELYVAGVDSGNVFKIIDANLSTENYELSKIKMYPNPTKNELTFDLLDTYSRIQSINIYSIQGKLLKSITNFTNPLFTIFVDKMSSGLYLIEIKDKSEVKETRKLILN
ncbi:MAG TPA: PQQ-dependent sugar dehydrogenase, partial [Flavobacteriaceae bacterium]|nr:PQQ-dependent sugar dehydrogenase [Flavobacteriaceae bacterium]